MRGKRRRRDRVREGGRVGVREGVKVCVCVCVACLCVCAKKETGRQCEERGRKTVRESADGERLYKRGGLKEGMDGV